jgi:uncharacterized membrane protein
MAPEYSHEIIACAAILIAALVMNYLPREVRRALFVLVFGTGALAAVAGIANAAGIETVAHLFG